mmetsp:Transcript_4838/g.16152  ORF Transcript_4838/g.16152 Transcript_4838/m.16152 type:complete len:200 (+) Transcript_4838:749-1348(+)
MRACACVGGSCAVGAVRGPVATEVGADFGALIILSNSTKPANSSSSAARRRSATDAADNLFAASVACSPLDFRFFALTPPGSGFHCATIRAARTLSLPFPLFSRRSTRCSDSSSCEKKRASTASADNVFTAITPAMRSTSAPEVSLAGALSIFATFAGCVSTRARRPAATCGGRDSAVVAWPPRGCLELRRMTDTTRTR